jgi:hypothetical protein
MLGSCRWSDQENFAGGKNGASEGIFTTFHVANPAVTTAAAMNKSFDVLMHSQIHPCNILPPLL